MSGASTPDGTGDRGKRRYDSPVRREQVAETRDRILTAAAELVHGYPTWDWKELTFRAVAERAGVGERTVYRHFPSERELHDALLAHLAVQAGVSYEGMELDDLAPVAAKVFAALSLFAVSPLTEGPPLFPTVDRQRRDAVLGAVASTTVGWPDEERQKAAAVLDVLWSVASFERIVTKWALDSEDATQAIIWAIGLVIDALREGGALGTS
jgi:AcrR family transcriptional regulator